MMLDFQYWTPTQVAFGRNAVSQTAELLKNHGARKVLIHYGGGSVVRSGLLDRITGQLDEAGVPYVSLGGAVPNPRLGKVREGIELCRRENVDFVLAVGGGSAIDSAKAIAYGVPDEGDVWDLFEGKRKAEAALPVGVVLTLSATGSEMSASCVITNEDGWVKKGYGSQLGRPVFAVMDPSLTLTLPAWQTACGCTDILMHTMERYFNNGARMEITDSIAEALLKTVMRYAVVLRDHPEDYEARAEVMWAGSLSHNGLTGCGTDGGDWMSHKLEHELSGLYDVAHGAGLAAVWGSWARYVMPCCPDRFRRFAVKVMDVPDEGTDEEVGLKGVVAMEDFFRSIGMPVSLKELGVAATDADLELMARKCAITCGGGKGSARLLKEADMLAIYRMARGE